VYPNKLSRICVPVEVPNQINFPIALGSCNFYLGMLELAGQPIPSG